MSGGAINAVDRAIAAEVGEGPLADALRALSRQGTAAGGGAAFVNLDTTTFVGPNGHDTGPLAGVRGQIERPFLTINAALAAMVDFDTLIVSSGTYVENVVIPASIREICIRGMQRDTTSIEPATGAALTFAPTGQGFLELDDIALIPDDLSVGLVVDGTPGGGMVGLRMLNVITYGATLTAVGDFIGADAIDIDRLESTTNLFSIAQSGGGSIRASRITAGLQISYDQGAPSALPAGPSMLRIDDSVITGPGLTLLGQVLLTVASECEIGDDPGPNRPVIVVDATALSTFFAGGFDLSPLLYLAGLYHGDVLLAFPQHDPAQTSVSFADASRAEFRFAFSATTPGNQGGDTTVVQVLAHETTFLGQIQAGADLNIDLRGSFFEQVNLAPAGNGTFDRDRDTTYGVALAGGPAVPVTYAAPFPVGLGATDFNAITNPHGTIQAVEVAGFSNTGCTVSGAANSGTVDVTVVRT